MNRVTSKQITQPEDWWELFSLQASLEGLTLSEWIGEACRDRVIRDQDHLSPDVAKATFFSQRPSRGPAKGSKRKPKEPSNEN